MAKRIFQLIDLDRTLFDTSQFAKRITDEINKNHPGIGTELEVQFEEAYQKEETFFLLRYLRQEMGDQAFKELVRTIVEREGAGAFLLENAADRLAFAETLGQQNPAWGIVTYGDEVDQRMKLRIVGLEEAPTYLTDTPEKGSIIASWQNSDGTFTLPKEFGGQTVDELSFEDDKIRAFYDLPNNTFGIWITPHEDAKKRISEAGLPITHAKNMTESIERLRQYFL